MSNNPAVTLFLGIAVAMQWMEMDTAFFCPRKLWMPAWNFGYIWGNHSSGASLVAKMVKNLPAMQETWVWSLGQSPWATETFSHASTVCLYLQTSSPLSIFLRFQKFKYSVMDIESQRVIIDSILGWGFQHSSNERKIIYTEHVISQLGLRGTSFY